LRCQVVSSDAIVGFWLAKSGIIQPLTQQWELFSEPLSLDDEALITSAISSALVAIGIFPHVLISIQTFSASLHLKNRYLGFLPPAFK